MTSRLQQMQQSFQKRQMEEKEKQLLNLYSKNQQKALQKVNKTDVIPNGGRKNSSSTTVRSYSTTRAVKKSSPGFDKSRPLAPLNNNANKTKKNLVEQPRITVSQPTSKTNIISERQKAREDMKKKEAELLDKIKQQKAELGRVKSRKKDIVSENNTKNIANNASKPRRMPLQQSNNQNSVQRQKAQIKPTKRDPNLAECSHCGRSFAKDRIDKHENICVKTLQKKRKTFDATKMRTKGTEAEKYIRKGLHKKPDPPKKSNWRKKHQEFMKSINEAKKFSRHIAAGGKASDLPPPPPSDNSDYVQCPHCGRKFNEGAAERHIPKCQNIVSNKKGQPKNQWNNSMKKNLTNRK